MVDTKRASRREIHFTSLEDVLADLDAIEASHAAGTLTAHGNWSAGQVCEHVAILMECAVDGFPTRAPAPVRWAATLLFKKKALSGKPMPAGFKIPKQAAFLEPGADTTAESGFARLRTIVERVRGGERFSVPSPIFGRLTHSQWVTLKAGHAALHMSFLQPGGGAAGSCWLNFGRGSDLSNIVRTSPLDPSARSKVGWRRIPRFLGLCVLMELAGKTVCRFTDHCLTWTLLAWDRCRTRHQLSCRITHRRAPARSRRSERGPASSEWCSR